MSDNYNSIFGIEAPKFIFDPDNTAVEVELNHVIIIRDEADLNNIEHKDIITGYREFSQKGKHWIFEVDVLITKETNPSAVYTNLKQYEHTYVNLYRRRDGNPFTNNQDEPMLFFIESIEERYLSTYKFPDILRITFKSRDTFEYQPYVAPPAYSTEAQLYFDLLDPQPDTAIKDAIAEFIDGLVADGIYSKIDEMWLFAMNTSANAVKGMKAVKNVSLIDTVNFEAYRGFTQNSNSDYINTNFKPGVDGVNCQQNSAHYGIYSRTDSQVSASDIGIIDSSPNADIWIQARVSPNVCNYKVHIKNNNQASSITNSLGFYLIYNNSTVNYLYKNGSFVHSTNRTTTGLPDNNIYICRHNGSTAGTLRQYAFATIGGGLTAGEIANYHSRLETLLDYLGAGVV